MVTRALLLACLVSIQLTYAQEKPPSAEPHHTDRTLLITNLIFCNSLKPSISAGGFYQISLCKTSVSSGDHGEQIITPPRLYFHVLGSGSYNSRNEKLGFTGSSGLLYRTDATFGKMLGVVLQVATADAKYGPALRCEIMDNIGIQAGYLFGDDKSVFFSLDLFADVCKDLHLWCKQP